MNRNEIEHRLDWFLRCVDEGRKPPDDLLQFIAAGVREHLAGGKPWPVSKGGRPARLSKGAARRRALQAYALRAAGIDTARAADLLGKVTGDSPPARTIQRWAKDGESIAAAPHELQWAIDALPVTGPERAKLQTLVPVIDEREATYDKN